MPNIEHHYNQRTGWLRAAVLGANDGIVSTSSLVMGFAFAHTDHTTILLAGLAGLISGAISMAAGEYVSVSSQADTERADLEREKYALENNYDEEHEELEQIYIKRGIDKELANKVATQLMAHDALGAHARDEIGISSVNTARPVQAAITSAAAFSVGSFLPVLLVIITPIDILAQVIAICSLLFLSLLGAISAKAGGAKPLNAILRVTLWGTAAMIITALVGHVFGVMIL